MSPIKQMRDVNGWLLDVYAAPLNGVSVWMIDEQGAAHHFHDDLQPHFFVAGTERELHAVCDWLNRSAYPVALKRARRYEVFERRELVVLQVCLLRVNDYARVVRRVVETFPALRYYHADLTIPQFYFFEKGVFPFARCAVRVAEAGRILEIAAEDSLAALDYALPPLRVMTLAMEGEVPLSGGSLRETTNPKNPRHGYRAPLVVGYDGQEYVLADTSPQWMLESLRRHLLQYDPDVILSDYGDSYILGYLMSLERAAGMELPLSRDRAMHVRSRRAQSRFSYGRIMFQPESHWLFGRLHLDRQEAILFDDYGWHGAVEMARLSQRAFQHSARSTIGGAVSALENAIAYKNGCLIPLHKEQAADFQTADELVRIDRGGLVYQPVAGLHFNVDLLDFKAMFPAIMATYNIGGETVNCPCCPDHYVPELRLRICRKRRGIVPLASALIVQKRFGYKRLMRETPSEEARNIYHARDAASKWCGVAIFGFAAHTSAKFGLISAHSAVCAYAREFILRAKGKAERRGFRMLHLITDCLFLHKDNATDAELEELGKEIEQATGLPIALEARFRWAAFLNSRVDARRSVPNMYFAASREGGTKIRGIAARRHDTPAWIAQAQRELIEKLAEAGTRAAIAARLPDLMQIVTRELDRLRSGQVPLHLLTIACSLSKLPSEYKVNNLNAAVARQLEAHGIELQPGERIRYVVLNHAAELDSDRVLPWDLSAEGQEGYDAAYYEELFLRACEQVFTPLGITAQMLRDGVAQLLPLPVMQKRIAAPATPYYGPLFAASGRPGASQ